MSERGIIMGAWSVRQILAGRKTATRRVIKPRNRWVARDLKQATERDEYHRAGGAGDGSMLRGAIAGLVQGCLHGQPGDLLWCRERQRVIETWVPGPDGMGIRVRYEADGAESGWLPYPERLKGTPVVGKCLAYGGYRESSRLTLRVTDVRVERVQDISEEDARAEGVTGHDPEPVDEGGTIYAWPGRSSAPCPRAHFAHLWDSINGRRPGCSWADNPWTWAVSFERVTP